MTENRKVISAVMLALLMIGFWLFTRIQPNEKPASEETNSTEAANVTTSEALKAEGVVTQSDGSVIVRDKGASFKIR